MGMWSDWVFMRGPRGKCLRTLVGLEGFGDRRRLPPNFKSENQLQCELKLPRGPVGLGDHAGRGVVGTAIENDLIGVREIGVVESVEHLRPELSSQFLGDRELIKKQSGECGQALRSERSKRHVG